MLENDDSIIFIDEEDPKPDQDKVDSNNKRGLRINKKLQI